VVNLKEDMLKYSFGLLFIIENLFQSFIFKKFIFVPFFVTFY